MKGRKMEFKTPDEILAAHEAEARAKIENLKTQIDASLALTNSLQLERGRFQDRLKDLERYRLSHC